jgi:SNF2 family DNA or RNA helicase
VYSFSSSSSSIIVFNSKVHVCVCVSLIQVDGVNWMVKQYNRGVGGILGDEMGLGKTLQALTFLATLKDNATRHNKRQHQLDQRQAEEEAKAREDDDVIEVDKPGDAGGGDKMEEQKDEDEETQDTSSTSAQKDEDEETQDTSSTSVPRPLSNGDAASPSTSSSSSSSSSSAADNAASTLLPVGARGCSGPHLVVTPLAVVQNWINELRRFTPGLTVIKVSGSLAERRRVLDDPKVASGAYDVYLTTYETVLSEEAFFTEAFLWHTVIIDEGHRLKNETSRLCGALGRVQAPFRILLTGTPLQNSMHELWALLHFLLPQVFTVAGAKELFDSAVNVSRPMK